VGRDSAGDPHPSRPGARLPGLASAAEEPLRYQRTVGLAIGRTYDLIHTSCRPTADHASERPTSAGRVVHYRLCDLRSSA
jgi:hypothetical protein